MSRSNRCGRMFACFGLGVCLILSVVGFASGEAPDQTPQETPQQVADTPTVARAVITSGVVDHEAQDVLAEVSSDLDRIYCWTDVRGAKDQVLEHAWIHEGVTRARVSIPIRSDRWRCYSSKQLLPAWTGNWQVKVFTEDGRVLATADFVVR